ncbi:multicopper oxidase family protein [Demequina sp.]|uniref:multicopper oxidase family protein n=1 Tax=Demequina sp. TaxID=2050685 RepID=UPI0025CD5D09|nr:multicopper oxidase family protein [Demequina sp.]
MWALSLVPARYSAMSMGYVDLGGGPGELAPHTHGAGYGEAPLVEVTDLTEGSSRAPDVSVTLTAARGAIRLGDGDAIDGYTLNGGTPGPEIRARVGDLVEVTLVNTDIDAGITLHWHGIDVPNAADGVAGITQDALAPGESQVYRFVAKDAGTYWYHSHQVAHEQVRRGLLGAIVIEPAAAEAGAPVDVVALAHLYGAAHTINGAEGDLHVDIPAGASARVRIINTDNGALFAWLGSGSFRVLAVDGHDLNGPSDVSDAEVRVPAGGRVDLLIARPADGSSVRLHLGGPRGVVIGPADPEPVRAPTGQVDLLSYGEPAPAPFDATAPDRRFDYVIGRRWGFLDGRPGAWWTINGHLYPDVPMFTVEEGDVVMMRLANHSGQAHPMHLHGHHALVLSRDGVPSTGSPWWVDSLEVLDGEEYEIAFVADNPGIWMDHCHNLPHAQEGLVAHLAYANVTTPFLLGGDAKNEPE